MKLLKNKLNNADTSIEVLYYHMNMNLLVSHVDSI